MTIKLGKNKLYYTSEERFMKIIYKEMCDCKQIFFNLKVSCIESISSIRVDPAEYLKIVDVIKCKTGNNI